MGEGSYGAMTYTTEIFNISSKSWSAGPEFMIHQSGYCAIALNDSHVFLVGGWWQEEQCFIFNLEDETFQEVPCLQSGGRRHHSCTRTADGRVAVAGGCHPTLPYGCTDKPDTYTAELEYYDPATNSWSYGTPLDQPVVGASLVADGDDLLLLGGCTAKGLQDTVYRLRGEEWKLLDIKLDTKDMDFPTFSFDASIYVC